MRHEPAVVAQNADTSIMQMIQHVLDKGVTADNASALDKLADLHLKLEAVKDRKSHAAAFAAMQRELPTIHATREIRGTKGELRSRFASIEDIMVQLKPCLSKFGFSISFDSEYGDDRVTAICILTHESGHSESRKFSVRQSGPPGTSVSQADGSTLTYAKRYALCNMFNISIGHDNDARPIGEAISKEHAAELLARLTAVGGNPDRFLRLAGAESFETIMSASVGVLENFLSEREREIAAKRQGQPSPEGSVKPTSAPVAARQSWVEFVAELRVIALDMEITPAQYIAGVSKWVQARGKAGKEDTITNPARAELSALVAQRKGDFAAV
jgi:hypothetical protein